MTEQPIFRIIKEYYGTEAAVIGQVANSTGAGVRRHIDAVAIGLWPSRGLYIHAIEIKISHGDLKRELDNPAKADEIARYCDAFYIAAPFGPIEGVPESWGWYTIIDGKAKKVKKAEQIECSRLTKSFVAAIARRLVEQAAPEAMLEEAKELGRAEARKQFSAELRRANDAELAAIRKYQILESSMRGIDVDAVNQMRAIIRNFRGEVGSLNAIRVNAAEIQRHADAIEKLSKRVLVEKEEKQ